MEYPQRDRDRTLVVQFIEALANSFMLTGLQVPLPLKGGSNGTIGEV